MCHMTSRMDSQASSLLLPLFLHLKSENPWPEPPPQNFLVTVMHSGNTLVLTGWGPGFLDAQDCWLKRRPTLIGRWPRKETNPCHQGGSWYFRRLKTASMMRLDLLSGSRPVPIGGTHQLKGSGRMLKINLVLRLGDIGWRRGKCIPLRSLWELILNSLPVPLSLPRQPSCCVGGHWNCLVAEYMHPFLQDLKTHSEIPLERCESLVLSLATHSSLLVPQPNSSLFLCQSTF